MPLIKEKIGVDFAGVYPGTCGAHCGFVAPLREVFQVTAQRNRNVRSAS
jgi:hypothetical protein